MRTPRRRPTKDELTTALSQALDDQIWMSGADTFGPEGEAHEHWKVVRERLFKNLDLIARVTSVKQVGR